MKAKWYDWLKLAGVIGVLLASSGCGTQPAGSPKTVGQAVRSEDGRVSRFGEYKGYSDELYDSWMTTSRYVTMRDGTRIAIDISRPASGGVVTDLPYPLLWTDSRYHRRWGDTPSIDNDPVMQRVLKHGYVVVAAQVRGGGASFGRYQGLFSEAETNDSYDLIDWLSKQPWCDGNVGMYGESYLGITQYMAASRHHPALKAIIPRQAIYDFYDDMYPNGVYREDMVRTWSDNVRDLDTARNTIVPVDADTDGSLADQAVAEHRDNFDPIPELRASPLRDSGTDAFSWYRDTPSMVMDKVNSSGVAIYHWGSWYDAYTLDTLLFYRNFTGSEKLAIGPWPHSPVTDKGRQDFVRVLGAESLRWYDYWLKGIDNGVMDDAPVNFVVVDVPLKEWNWHSTGDLQNAADRVDYYFEPANEADERVPDDNGLGTSAPAQEVSYVYPVNLETSTGAASRWDSTVGGPDMNYPEMTPNDRRSLTFTTPPLEEDVTVLGTPVVTLYASSSKTDADFHVILEEVDADGTSHYVSEGEIRGSFRALHEAPWDNLGIPWHRGRKEDLEPMVPGTIYELKFYMEPTGNLFNAGNRIRIAVMGADKDNYEAPPEPAAVLTILAGGAQASRISFPIAKPW